MIAGGVGITPMMSMVRAAADRRDPRPHRLVVVARNHEDLLFRDELGWLREDLDLEITEVLRRPHPGWEGHTGEINVGMLAAVLGTDHEPRAARLLPLRPARADPRHARRTRRARRARAPRPHRTVRHGLTSSPDRSPDTRSPAHARLNKPPGSLPKHSPKGSHATPYVPQR